MPEARDVAGLLYVRAKIDNVDERLFVTLRLHVAAHETDSHERTPVMSHETRHQCVEWALLGRDCVGTVRIEREESAAIVQYEPITGHRDSGSESVIVAVD